MKLYYAKGACSLTVHIILLELEIPFEHESVDLKTKQTASGEDFFSISPKGSVPVLVLDNNDILTENIAILQYLADTYHATSLLPSVGHMLRYRIIEWLSFLSSDVHKSFSPFFNPYIPQDLKETIFLPLLEKKFEILDKRLTNHEYLVGINFTLPDAYLFVMLRWYNALKFDMSKHPHVLRYFNDLKTRSTILQAMNEEGIKA